MAREPGVVSRSEWRASEPARQAYLAWLEAEGDAELAEFYRRHPRLMEGAVWAFERGDRRVLPSVADVLDQAALVAAREAAAFVGPKPAGVLVVAFPPEELDAEAGNDWWRERVGALRKLDPKAYVASCRDALAGRRGVFVFSEREESSGG